LKLAVDRLSLRIGFLAGTLGRGGAERQLVYMLRALQNEGVKPRVLCLTKGEPFEQEILELGIRLDWVGASKNNFVRLKTIIANLRQIPVDVIQSAHFYTNIYAALAGRTLGVESIGAIRSDLVNEMSANPTFGRWHLKLPCRLIANSQLAVDRSIAKGIDQSRVHLLRNAVLDANHRHSRDSSNHLNILFAGRLDSPKRPEKFIELAQSVSAIHNKPKLKFLIAGDGPLRASLESLVKENGLDPDRIALLGEQADMTKIYQKSDILVLTSLHEGTPNVVLEAMANGLAVVATRVGGVPEVLKEDCGMVVDPHDFSELVKATSMLITDREKRIRMGENGRIFVRENHSIDYLQRELLDIYSRFYTNPEWQPKVDSLRALK
jgi:glycosyltransferase involved in cell wall biosynthesis